MLSVGQKVKVSERPYAAKKDGFITKIFDHDAYMVASDKTLPEHFFNPATGEYHLYFWEEELESIK
jgi:hypothetical protein